MKRDESGDEQEVEETWNFLRGIYNTNISLLAPLRFIDQHIICCLLNLKEFGIQIIPLYISQAKASEEAE